MTKRFQHGRGPVICTYAPNLAIIDLPTFLEVNPQKAEIFAKVSLPLAETGVTSEAATGSIEDGIRIMGERLRLLGGSGRAPVPRRSGIVGNDDLGRSSQSSEAVRSIFELSYQGYSHEEILALMFGEEHSDGE